MPDIPEQAPAREAKSKAAKIWAALASCFLFCCAVAVGALHGPLLVRDFGLQGELAPATAYHVTNAECRGRLFWFCTVKAAEFPGGPGHEAELRYTFFDPISSKYTIAMLQKRSDPAVISTDLGQERLWNRAATLAGVLAVVGLLLPGLILWNAKKE